MEGEAVIPDARPSPFLYPGLVASSDSLAILHLRRDNLIPTVLSGRDDADDGYAEGRVLNTRFGSFPHSTLIGLPWGSQVRASKVDTGSRGRPESNQNRKRKRGGGEADGPDYKEPTAAATGFAHILPPTPESWTYALPHRTQVVYTPDYSYIIHRLRIRPGSVVIEAGAGSGSFSHACVRAAFSGYPDSVGKPPLNGGQKTCGKIWSYEFHEQRVTKLRQEIKEHGLSGLIHVTHRDVCQDGFLLDGSERDTPNDPAPEVGVSERRSPNAQAVFLDLPAPWLALPHLTRRRLPTKQFNALLSNSASQSPAPNSTPLLKPITNGTDSTPNLPFISPIDPSSAIRICTFSPCIEQVHRTVTTLRQLGWVEIDMVEIAHRRIEVRRERVGLQETAGRGVTAVANSVEESLERLKDIATRSFKHHEEKRKKGEITETLEDQPEDVNMTLADEVTGNDNTEPLQVDKADNDSPRKVFNEGRLVHRTESEIKSHTSYLVFATLPREWTAEDEERANSQWPIKDGINSPEQKGKMSKRQMRKAEKAAQHGAPKGKPKVQDNSNIPDTEMS